MTANCESWHHLVNAVRKSPRGFLIELILVCFHGNGLSCTKSRQGPLGLPGGGETLCAVCSDMPGLEAQHYSFSGGPALCTHSWCCMSRADPLSHPHPLSPARLRVCKVRSV